MAAPHHWSSWRQNGFHWSWRQNGFHRSSWHLRRSRTKQMSRRSTLRPRNQRDSSSLRKWHTSTRASLALCPRFHHSVPWPGDCLHRPNTRHKNIVELAIYAVICSIIFVPDTHKSTAKPLHTATSYQLYVIEEPASNQTSKRFRTGPTKTSQSLCLDAASASYRKAQHESCV